MYFPRSGIMLFLWRHPLLVRSFIQQHGVEVHQFCYNVCFETTNVFNASDTLGNHLCPALNFLFLCLISFLENIKWTQKLHIAELSPVGICKRHACSLQTPTSYLSSWHGLWATDRPRSTVSQPTNCGPTKSTSKVNFKSFSGQVPYLLYLYAS